MSCASVGSAGRTVMNSGCGLPRQKFDSVHVALRSIDSFEFSWSCWRSGCIAPSRNTKSRHVGESPAMLPSAQTCAGVNPVSLCRSPASSHTSAE